MSHVTLYRQLHRLVDAQRRLPLEWPASERVIQFAEHSDQTSSPRNYHRPRRHSISHYSYPPLQRSKPDGFVTKHLSKHKPCPNDSEIVQKEVLTRLAANCGILLFSPTDELGVPSNPDIVRGLPTEEKAQVD